MGTVALSRFERDTAVSPRGDGHYTVTVDAGWTIYLGPNGGYVAALAARALCAEVEAATASPEPRQLRSLSAHFLSPPQVGEMVAEVVIEHTGGSVSIASVVLRQKECTRVMGRASFAASRTGIELDHARAPNVPSPEDLPPLDEYIPSGFRDRYDRRWAIGPMPHSLADVALAGGWIRPARTDAGSSPTPLDAPLVVAYSDCWFPAVYAMTPPSTKVYTVDLSVHLVAPLPSTYDDWVLVEFESIQAAEGLVVEDGRIWNRTGDLLATSRQLAVVRSATSSKEHREPPSV